MSAIGDGDSGATVQSLATSLAKMTTQVESLIGRVSTLETAVLGIQNDLKKVERAVAKKKVSAEQVTSISMAAFKEK